MKTLTIAILCVFSFNKTPFPAFQKHDLFIENKLTKLTIPKKPQKIAEIACPSGYQRIKYTKNSYSDYIQHLSYVPTSYVKAYKNDSLFWDCFGVINLQMLFPNADIEQCADWAMRLWVEYHQSTNQLDSLFLFNYAGKKNYYKTSGKNLKDFMKWSFGYTNSFSLKKGCRSIASTDLKPGDMIVQNDDGGIGHVSVIFDMCEKNKEKLYLIGFSYMPAQEMHIQIATEYYGIQGWFTLEGFYKYLDDHLNLGKPVLRRF
jgi:hypothetical protein